MSGLVDPAVAATVAATLIAIGCGLLFGLLVRDPRRPVDTVQMQRELDAWLRARARRRRVALRTRVQQAVRRRLDRAGHDTWSLRVFALLCLASAAAGGLAGWSLLGTPLFAALGAAGAGSTPWVWLGHTAARRALARDMQVAHLIVVIAGAVATGHSVQHIIEEVVPRTVGPPLAEMVQRVTRRLDPARGVATVTLSDVLADLDARLHSPAFSLARMTIQEALAGGTAQLAASLEMIASLARDDLIFRTEVRAQFTLIRGTAGVVFAVPLILTLALRLVEPGLVEAAYSTPLGWIVAAAVTAASMGAYALVTATERRAARALLEAEP